MNKSIFVLVFFLLITAVSNGQEIVKEKKFDSDKIKSELAEKYKSYNGNLEDQTVEMWDSYFLKSENIGNMHEGMPEIGWKTFHEGTIKFLKNKYKGELLIDNIEIYPINSNTAWVKGMMITKINDQIYKSVFYDSLVKTVDGWRVILSVVNDV